MEGSLANTMFDISVVNSSILGRPGVSTIGYSFFSITGTPILYPGPFLISKT